MGSFLYPSSAPTSKGGSTFILEETQLGAKMRKYSTLLGTQQIQIKRYFTSFTEDKLKIMILLTLSGGLSERLYVQSFSTSGGTSWETLLESHLAKPLKISNTHILCPVLLSWKFLLRKQSEKCRTTSTKIFIARRVIIIKRSRNNLVSNIRLCNYRREKPENAKSDLYYGYVLICAYKQGMSNMNKS